MPYIPWEIKRWISHSNAIVYVAWEIKSWSLNSNALYCMGNKELVFEF